MVTHKTQRLIAGAMLVVVAIVAVVMMYAVVVIAPRNTVMQRATSDALLELARTQVIGEATLTAIYNP